MGNSQPTPVAAPVAAISPVAQPPPECSHITQITAILRRLKNGQTLSRADQEFVDSVKKAWSSVLSDDSKRYYVYAATINSGDVAALSTHVRNAENYRGKTVLLFAWQADDTPDPLIVGDDAGSSATPCTGDRWSFIDQSQIKYAQTQIQEHEHSLTFFGFFGSRMFFATIDVPELKLLDRTAAAAMAAEDKIAQEQANAGRSVADNAAILGDAETAEAGNESVVSEKAEAAAHAAEDKRKTDEATLKRAATVVAAGASKAVAVAAGGRRRQFNPLS